MQRQEKEKACRKRTNSPPFQPKVSVAKEVSWPFSYRKRLPCSRSSRLYFPGPANSNPKNTNADSSACE